MVDGVRIDELAPTVAPSREHTLPTMKDGLPYQILVGQIADLILAAIRDGAPEAYDTLKELATFTTAINAAVTANATAIGDAQTAINTINGTGAGGKQPIDAMLTALAALTSANGKFLAFTGVDAPAVRDIIGTVAQTGGVPTGALFEYGSNANGYYLRLPNGVQVMWGEFIFTPTASSAFTDVDPIPLPATFYMTGNTPSGVASLNSNYGNGVGAATFRTVNPAGNTCAIRALNTSSLTNTAATSRGSFIIFGRWF